MSAARDHRRRALVLVLVLVIAPAVVSSGALPVHATSTNRLSIDRRASCAGQPANVLLQRERASLLRENDQEVITVVAPDDSSTSASLSLWRRASDCYVLVGGPWSAEIGSTGLKEHKSEGDRSTPVGTYAIGPTMYGVSADPGLSYPYHHLVCGDWWDEDSSSPSYNRFVHVPCGTAPPFGGDSEALWQITPQYDYFAVVEYNDSPIIPGRGSAIFIHLSVGAPTAGCLALPETQLLTALRWLRPAAHPFIVIGSA